MASLAPFIRSHEYDIVQEWEKFAQKFPIAEHMSPKDLRNSIREMLRFIANDLTTPQTEQERDEKSKGHGINSGGDKGSSGEKHGGVRFTDNFDIVQLHAEFRALRASVLKLWTATWTDSTGGWLAPTDVISDLMRFNEAIDQMASESYAGHMKKLTPYINPQLMSQNKNTSSEASQA